MNNHNRRYGMFTSSPARRVSWLGMITLLGCVLLNAVSAQTTERVIPRTTPTPKIEVEKKTNTDTTAIHAMLTGSLSGTVYYYVRRSVGVMSSAPCTGNVTHIRLVGSNGKVVADVPIIPGKQDDKNAVCHYKFQDVPVGTYKLETVVYVDVGSGGIGSLAVLDMRPYLMMNIDSHPEEISCTGGGSPCSELLKKPVTIVGNKTSVLDLSVKIIK